jgi:hypothetical protein
MTGVVMGNPASVSQAVGDREFSGSQLDSGTMQRVACVKWVDITAQFEAKTRGARGFALLVDYPIARCSAATYFREADALVPIGSVAARSGQPAQRVYASRSRSLLRLSTRNA